MFIQTTGKNNKNSLYYQLNRKKINFKFNGRISKKIFKTFLFIIFLITIIFIMQNFLNNEKNDDYQVVKMNSNEYKIKINEELISLEVYTLLENPDLIKFSDDVYYYKDFMKYIDVSENTKIKSMQINDRYFINVKIAEKVDKYYQIIDFEDRKAVFELDYDFTDFESEMKELLTVYDKYPPTIEKVNMKDVDPDNYYQDYVYDHYIPNLRSEYFDEVQFEMYNWYIRELEITSFKLADKDTLKGFTLFIYLDGEDIEKIGDIDKIIPLYRFNIAPNEEAYDNIKDIDFPVKIDGCRLYNSGKIYGKSNLYFQLYYDYTTIECDNNFYESSVIQSMIIDFANETSILNFNNYNVQIEINDIVVSEDNFLVNGTRLYMMPIPVKYDLNMDSMDVTIKVMIKTQEGDRVFQFDHTMNFLTPK